MYTKLRYLFVVLSLSVTAAWSQEAELVHLWQFDGDVQDASGSANHGVIDGGAATYVPGRFGEAIHLNEGMGVTAEDAVNLPTGGTDAWSMNIWLNLDKTPTGLSTLASFAGRLFGEALACQRSYLQHGAGYYFWGYGADVDSGVAYKTDQNWHMYTITYDGAEIRMYLDGGLVKAQAMVLTDAYEAIVNIGGTSCWGINDVRGAFDDFSVWREVLSVGEIKMLLNIPTQQLRVVASSPLPEDESTDISRDVILTWTPSKFAATHDVYLGTVFEDVNDASRADDRGTLVSQGQMALAYDSDGVFEYGQTYYWRVDEVNGAPDNTIFKGVTWNFTVEPLAYPIANVTATSSVDSLPGAGSENMVNGSGLNENDEHSTESSDMWQVAPTGDDPLTIEYAFDAVYKLHEMLIWNYNTPFELMVGFGLKDVTIEYSENGEDWTVLGDVVLNQATAQATYTANTTVDFGGVAAQYVRITVNSGWGTLPMPQYGLSEARFLHIPVQGCEPQPADSAVDVAANADLTWRGGREAVSHEVYLSTDPDALELIDTTSTTTVDPGALDLGTTYYWRIDEVNDAEAISTWAGATWSFSTETYMVVEDFESYTDDIEAGEAIFRTWIDGYEINDNGSTVGYIEAPFAETTLVHGGDQSMPLFFDNTGGITVSEAERTLDIPMDWTAQGIKSLSLYFQGTADNSGQLYVKINGTKVVYDGQASDIKRTLWQPWNIDLSTVGGNLSNVTKLTIGIEGAGATGVVYIDDIGLYPKIPEFITPAEPDSANLLVHYTLDGDAADSSGNGADGEENGAPTYGDGVQGQAMQFDGIDDYVNVFLDVPENGSATAFWFKTTNPNCGLFAIAQNVLGAGGYDRLIYLTNGSVGVRIYDTEIITAAVNVADGQWHHLVHTYGDAIGGQKLYIDGLLQAQGVKAESNFDWQDRVLFGWAADAAEAYLEGMLDDARIYDRTLSAAEVAWLAGGETASIPQPF